MKNTLRISKVIIITLSIILIHSCTEKPTPPIITTTSVNAISYTTAASGGEVTNEGGAPVVSKGVCWNTSADPTIANSKTTEIGGSGPFTSNISSLTPNTMYYVRAYATNSAGTGYGNQVTFTTSQVAVPVLTTTAITSTTPTTIVTGGNITDDKGGSVTTRGVCYGRVTNPTIVDSKTTDGTGIGTYISNITQLIPNTTYYIRAYATNSAGTAYGNELIITTLPLTDADGNIYNTIVIGTQVWMKENLKTTKLKDNTTPIPNVTGDAAWAALSTPGYCWYGNNITYKDLCGALYNWYSVNTGNLCPSGWHVPTDADWTTLENYLIANGYNYDGTTTGNKIAKALSSSTLWQAYTGTGTVGNTDYSSKRNATGFTALPGGYRGIGGFFSTMGSYGLWWSATESNATNAWGRFLHYTYINLERATANDKKNGFSVRCLRD